MKEKDLQQAFENDYDYGWLIELMLIKMENMLAYMKQAGVKNNRKIETLEQAIAKLQDKNPDTQNIPEAFKFIG